MFNPGDLLLCIANGVSNPKWAGIKPTIGEYYTWRADSALADWLGYVNEIVSPISNFLGIEPAHNKAWYKKVEVDLDINQLMEETKLAETA